LSGGTIGAIVFGLVLTAVAFAHPIGPGLMVAAETPFDGIPFKLFGVAGNLITFVPILILLMRLNPAHWGQAFFGTRVQQLLALFIMALLPAHALLVADQGLGQVFEFLRKGTLFLLVGVFAFSMREEKYLALLVKTLVASMAVLTVFAMMDFYMGIQVLPVKAGRLEGAALGQEFDPYMATQWRFSAPGFPVNRYSNYLLLLIFLGIGWFMHVKNPLQRLIALACVVILVLAELFTVTRSGILGMGVGMVLMLPLALRLRVQHVFGALIVGGIIAAAGWYGASLTYADEVLVTRFGNVSDSLAGRFERVYAAFRIWADHPLLGSGWGTFSQLSPLYITEGGKGAHNGYLNVLAETGVLGFLPLVFVTFAVVSRHIRGVGQMSKEFEFWRPYFLCGLIAQLITNGFNDYLWERYLWINFAFAAAIEQCYQRYRAQQARERLEQFGSSGESGSEELASRLGMP